MLDRTVATFPNRGASAFKGNNNLFRDKWGSKIIAVPVKGLLRSEQNDGSGMLEWHKADRGRDGMQFLL